MLNDLYLCSKTGLCILYLVNLRTKSTPLNVNSSRVNTPMYSSTWSREKVDFIKIRTPENLNHCVIQIKFLRIFCSN